jgi:hypothetical protein
MRRKDSKFVYSIAWVPGLLEAVKENYRVLEICGSRVQAYDTTYYDTANLDMYRLHHNGRVNRHKVRVRKYESSNMVFLEVKKKDARGVTMKNRVETNEDAPPILSSEEEFLKEYSPYHWRKINPVLGNHFKRITLVRHDQEERITLDFHLWFGSKLAENSLEVPGISIAEIKYSGLLHHSPFYSALRKSGILPRRFSKYCMGMAMLNPDLKQNYFKEKVRYIRKINREYLESYKQKTYA